MMLGGEALRRTAYWAVLAAGLVLMLHNNYPGHLSVDSVLSLREGRLEVRETWNPALFSWLLGRFDDLVRGTGLYLVASSALLFASLAALPLLRGRTAWTGLVLAAAALLLPQLMVYQAIVWKDVLFTNTAVAGFVFLALADRAEGRGRWAWLAASALMLAAAGLLRQNGLVLVPAAALALAWSARARGPAKALGLAAAWGLAVFLLSFLLSMTAQPQGLGKPDTAGARGLRILQHYDIAGAIARDPAAPLWVIDAANPVSAAYLKANAAAVYSPERVDTFSNDPLLGRTFWKLPDDVVRGEWLRLILRRPAVYLQTRAEVFRQVFATPIIDRCLPVHVGVSGPPPAIADLGLKEEMDPRDVRLSNYVSWFLDTPAMSHVAFAVLALALAGFLLVRRSGADIVVLAMLGGALLFTASFFVISIACDYRYLYFLDMAAIAAAIYVALDPRLRPARG